MCLRATPWRAGRQRRERGGAVALQLVDELVGHLGQPPSHSSPPEKRIK